MNAKTKKLCEELIETLGTDGMSNTIITMAMAEAELSGFTEANEKAVEILKRRMKL